MENRNTTMKGDISTDFLVKFAIVIIAMVVILAIGPPLLDQFTANSQGCNAFKIYITELGSGNPDLC